MKWVALVIIVCLVLYTVATLRYRKTGPGYEPYQDAKDRATVQRLESVGYQRITVTAETPADPRRTLPLINGNPATIQEAIGGLSSELQETLIDKPALPTGFSSVNASREANVLLPYTAQFTCTLPDNKQQITSTHVYVKEQSIAIVCSFEQLTGELLARTKETTVLLSLPAGSLQAGNYEVTLVGAHQSKRWALQVH